MDEEVFDAIVVGAGVAGTVAAYELARAGHEVVLIERGGEPGTKNLSGGVLYCRVMEEVFPGFATRAPVERRVTRHVTSFLNAGSSVDISYWDQRLAEPVNAVTVLRSRLDAWLVEQCEEAGVMVMPGIRVDELIVEGEQVVGVRAGDEELRARVVVVAEGVNSFLAQRASVRAKEPMEHLAVGVKSVIRLPRETLEERFQVHDGEGVAYAMVGDCTEGVAGGGFLYTNTDTVSIGVVMRLDDLVARNKRSSDIHDHFLTHPAVAPLLEGGEVLEYGSHLTIEDGPAMVRHDLTRPGLMLVGDAAGFTLNTGLTIRGMDLAAGSARAAAATAHEALVSGDLSQAAMDAYPARLEESWIGKDMRTYRRAPGLLMEPRMYDEVGLLAADLLHRVFSIDLSPRRRLLPTAWSVARASSLGLTGLARLGLRLVRSL